MNLSPFGATDAACASEVRRRIPELLPDLRARALRLTRDTAVAEEVVQDAIERALRFEHQYQANSNLRAWLSAIAASVFVSRCRRLRRERRALEVLATDPCAWISSDPAPSMRALSPCARRALDTIAPSFRQAIELVDIGGMSYRDAAETIHVPLGTIMSRLHRGRRLLARALSDARTEVPRAA
jgi:RNA polymerase sigma-70 factor (ECF subfamily)